MSSKYINIKRKNGSDPIEDYYMGPDVKKLAVTFTGTVATVTMDTVSGVTVVLALTDALAQTSAVTQAIADYFWGKIIEAAEHGPDFAGIAAQMGDAKAGIGELALTAGGTIEVTIDSVTIT